MMAFPDSTIAGNIDHDPGGICNVVLAHCDDGLLTTSINVQSMRGGVSTAGKGKGKGQGAGKGKGKLKGLNGTSKKALVLHQLAQRCVHVAGLQEGRGFKTGISTESGFVKCRSVANSAGSFGCALAINTNLS